MIEIKVTTGDDKKKKAFEDWEVESASATLIRAEEIKQDKELMKLVNEHVEKKQKAISSIADLKKVAKSKLREKAPEPDLITEEDKAALQEKKRIDKNLRDMGFKPKG